MKIRNGFVSNSSSSSYIVCVPKSFEIDEKELSEWAEDMMYDYKRKLRTITNAKKCIKDNLDKLKKSGELWSDKNPAFYVIQNILIKSDFIIEQCSGAAGWPDSIRNVGCDKTLEKIRKIMEI